MPPKIDFIADDSEPDFQPDSVDGQSFNLNDSIKLKPEQYKTYSPADKTGPEQVINPITKRPDDEGFWSKALDLPNARKESRGDNLTFSSGIDYSQVDKFVQKHIPGLTGEVLGKIGEFIAATPEGILSDPMSPALGLLGASRPRPIQKRLNQIKELPTEPLPLPSKLKTTLNTEGKVVPKPLVSPEDFGSQQTIKALEGKPIDFIPSAEVVPSAAKAGPVIDNTVAAQSNVPPEQNLHITIKNPTPNRIAEFEQKGYTVTDKSFDGVTLSKDSRLNDTAPKVESRVINDVVPESTANRLKALFTETEGSFKPQELVEGTKKAILKLRGKSANETDTIRIQLLDHLVNVGRIDVNSIYKQVEGKLSPTQFDKVLNDIIDSGDLQKAYKSKRATASSTQPATQSMKPVSLQDSLNSLTDAIGQHQQARLAQDELVRAEKSNRASKLESLKGQGYEGYQQQRETLKGAYSKVDVKPITDAASSINMDEMMNMVDSKLPDQFQAFRAKTAISKVFGLSEMKGALQPNEISLLSQVFGEELTQKLVQMNSVFGMPEGEMAQVGKNLARYSNLAKSIQASMDLSAPLRQGAPLAARKEFWPAAYNMFKYAGSEKKYKGLQEYLATEWKHRDLAKAARLSITRIGSDMRELPLEEHFLSELPEKIPVLGKMYRGSERAYVGFLDKLRADTFSSLIGDMERAGIKTHDVVKIRKMNPETRQMETINKIIPSKEVLDTAKFVNTATGRGSLGAAERYGDLLNTIFYSPRFQTSRLDMMTKVFQPSFYTKTSPALRREYLRALLSMGGVAATTNGIGYALGGKLTSNPTSSDFGKVVYHGKTRQDPGAGFLQYLTLAAREITRKTTSSTGKTTDIKPGGFNSPLSVAGRFTRNKLAPIPGLAVSAFEGKNPIGEDFDTLDETGKLVVPLIIQDLTNILKNDPKAFPLIVPATLGQGIQVYEDLKKKKEKQSGSFLGRELKRTN